MSRLPNYQIDFVGSSKSSFHSEMNCCWPLRCDNILADTHCEGKNGVVVELAGRRASLNTLLRGSHVRRSNPAHGV